ncbi:hypothetical protein D3C85_881440 [compost metagenome]
MKGKGSYFTKELTQEEKNERAAKARLGRAEKSAAGALLKQSWMDEPHWRRLASKYNVRLPLAYNSNSEVKHLKRIMKAVGCDYKDYLEACGFTNLKQFHKENPLTPAFAECGMFLEFWDEKQNEQL